MFPFKDAHARQRPPLLTATLVALGLGLRLAGVLHGGVLALLLCLLALAIFGQSVEDVLGTGRYALLCLSAAALTFAVQALLGPTAAAPTLAAAGLAAAVPGAYLALRPRGRILTLVLAPLFAGVIALPAVALAAAWLLAQLLIGATHLDEPLAHIGAAWFAHLLALPLALLALRALTRAERRPLRPTPRGRPPRRLTA